MLFLNLNPVSKHSGPLPQGFPGIVCVVPIYSGCRNIGCLCSQVYSVYYKHVCLTLSLVIPDLQRQICAFESSLRTLFHLADVRRRWKVTTSQPSLTQHKHEPQIHLH